MTSDKGKLIVVSGPSGAGKSTVIHQVMAWRGDVRFSVSATTRAPREGEVDGVDYWFVTQERFQEMIGEQALLEHACYVGNYYGTPEAPVRQALETGESVILDIEVQGAFQVKEHMPEAVLVFLCPPSFSELEKRLRGRNQDSEDKILRRIETAKQEYTRAGAYDYIVINDDAQLAARELDAIITAEKCRCADRLTRISRE